MLFRRNRDKPPPPADDIPERIHKRLHIIYFFLKCVICAAVFGIFYNSLCVLLLDVPEAGSEESPFLRHEYCGTFYVEVNRENSFASQEDYSAYINRDASVKATPADIAMTVVVAAAAAAAVILLAKKKLSSSLSRRTAQAVIIFAACWLITPDLPGASGLLSYIMLFLALRSGDKKTVFCKRASEYFLIGGAASFVSNLVNEVTVFIKTSSLDKELSGVFSSPEYYLQLYDAFGIPFVMLCAGSMLRRHELDTEGGGTSRNSSLLKCSGYALGAGTGGFVLWRLGVRVYELICVLTDGNCTVKLPFTVMDNPWNRLIELPADTANSPQAYRNAVLFRFVKDLPVFILAWLAVWCFIRVLFALSEGELNTAGNRRKLSISMILLVAASLWFNIMGWFELGFFNKQFTGIYGEVVYTIALRSKTEPMLYVLVLWFFKTYLQTIPEAEK